MISFNGKTFHLFIKDGNAVISNEKLVEIAHKHFEVGNRKPYYIYKHNVIIVENNEVSNNNPSSPPKNNKDRFNKILKKCNDIFAKES